MWTNLDLMLGLLLMTMIIVLKHMRRMNFSMKINLLEYRNMKITLSLMEKDLTNLTSKNLLMQKIMKSKFTIAHRDPVGLALMFCSEK